MLLDCQVYSNVAYCNLTTLDYTKLIYTNGNTSGSHWSALGNTNSSKSKTGKESCSAEHCAKTLICCSGEFRVLELSYCILCRILYITVLYLKQKQKHCCEPNGLVTLISVR